MTASEAIDYLQREEMCHRLSPCGLNCGPCPWNVRPQDFKKAYHMAIEALGKLEEEDK